MGEKKNGALIKIITAVTFAAMVAVNALANILPINGVNTGQVSDAYQNLFAPASITFAVWGLIYFLLAAFTLYHLGLFHGKGRVVKEQLLRKTGIVFSISSVANIAWIFSWHYDIILLSMILMIVILVCLIYLTGIIRREGLTVREVLFIRVPFSIYFGWITIATIANATTLLVSWKWNGFGLPEQTWTIILLVIGAVIGAVTTFRRRDISYGLVLIWAFAGIWIKHSSASGFSGQYPDIVTTTIACIVFLIVAVACAIFLKRRGYKTENR